MLEMATERNTLEKQKSEEDKSGIDKLSIFFTKTVKTFFDKTLDLLSNWSFNIYNIIFIILLILARYLFEFNYSFLIDTIQIILYFETLLLFITTATSITKWNDVTRKPWQIVLTAIFVITLTVLLIKGDFSGNFHEWWITWMINGYLAAMTFIIFFGKLIKLTEKLTPALSLPSSFLMVILCGAALLFTPKATTGDITLVDAIFTSTSATCVTGLIVLDTGTEFTFLGQLIILLLIQVGGLGLMTFAAFFAISLGQKMGRSGATNLSKIMDTEFTNDLKHILLSILAWTLIIESIGALLLYNSWIGMEGLGWSVKETIWQAIFHSVSAFCNAGFSLNSTNLEQFANSPSTSIIISFLIILGGLGFMVLTTIGTYWLKRIRTGRSGNLQVQAKIVLLVSGILIFSGTFAFLIIEWNNTLIDMSFIEKLSNSFLQGVTPRTAGFNTVPTGELLAPIKWFFLILMFIGASPGGTGGGVKTTTFALLILSLRSLIFRRKNPEVWKKKIPIFDLQRAGAILLVGMTTFALSSFFLLITEANQDSNYPAVDYIFEAMSAFGTVGLSTGVTAVLSVAGKWIIIITMFIGRTAPATLAAATSREQTSNYSYPEARITIG